MGDCTNKKTNLVNIPSKSSVESPNDNCSTSSLRLMLYEHSSNDALEAPFDYVNSAQGAWNSLLFPPVAV